MRNIKYIVAIGLIVVAVVSVIVIFFPPPKKARWGTLVRITKGPADELSPVFSPDGKKIAFTRRYYNKTGTFFEIAVMDLETNETNVIFSFSDLENICRTGEIKEFSTIEIHRLSWYGNKIIFNTYCTFPITLPLTCELKPLSPEETKAHDIGKDKIIKMVMINDDGSDPQIIAPGEHPYWSPDGKKILYLFKSNFLVSVCGRCGKEIHIMDIEDGEDTLVYKQNNTLFWPTFSPDGKLIVFSRREDPIEKRRNDIYLIDATGNNLRKLTSTNDNTYPAFTPDGNEVIFVSDESGNDELYSLNLKNLKMEKLTNVEAIEACCINFSPDGNKLVFSMLPKEGDKGFDIWMMEKR